METYQLEAQTNFYLNPSENVFRIVREGRRILKPLDNTPVSVWAEKNRILKHGSSSRPGQWRNSLVPYMVEIMDCVTDPKVEEISVMSSAQIAKTEVLMNIVGRTIDLDPCPIMLLFPTIDAGRKFSKTKFAPMLRDTRSLVNKIAKEKSRSADNSMLEKKFEGGFLIIVGANSPTGLASHSIKILLADDVDRMPPTVSDEGDPLSLGEKRTQTYEGLGAKKIAFSTPTVEETSRIKKKYNNSDQRQFYVPCPECGYFQTLKFDNLQWDKEPLDAFGDEHRHLPETVKYACENCGTLISEKYKYSMLQKGEWRADRPEVTKHRGYWINELYSLFSSWESIVKKFLDSKDDPDARITFENTCLARTVKLEEAKEMDETGLMKRVEEYIPVNNYYSIPDEILFLTCTVDVQHDRLEYMVRGWGMDEENWDVQYDRIYGDPDQDDVWRELDLVLERKWTRRDGVVLNIKITLVDSGYLADRVYTYTRRREHKNVFAIKGKEGYGRPIVPKKYSEVGKPVAKLFIIGIDTAKQTILNWLNVTQAGPRYMHFSKVFSDAEYFKALTAEKRVVKRTHTGAYVVWQKKSVHQANEVLDLHVYSIAAMRMMVPNWAKIKESRDRQAEEIRNTRGSEKNTPEVKEAEILSEEKKDTVIKEPVKNKSKKRLKITSSFSGWRL